MPVLDDIATYLDAQSTALTKLAGTAGNLVKGQMVDTTAAGDTLVALYDTQGFENRYSFSTGTGVAVDIEQPSMQILSRSTTYQTARDNCVVAYQILDGYSGPLPTATGTEYLGIAAAQAPFFIGRDENDRYLFSVNFNIMKQTT